jgi:hypothetical protein
MAIPEACGVWIEQRIKEELDTKGETGDSLREIGRKIAAEVEKYFEAKVSPETIKSKALRMQAGSNEPPQENATNTGDNSGDTGDKLTPVEISAQVEKELPNAGSEREACRIVAEKTGKSPEAVKKAHQREKKQNEKLELWTCTNCGKDSPTTEGFCNSCAAPMPIEKSQKRGDSKTLFELKRLWVRATKKDRILFLEWTKPIRTGDTYEDI